MNNASRESGCSPSGHVDIKTKKDGSAPENLSDIFYFCLWMNSIEDLRHVYLLSYAVASALLPNDTTVMLAIAS